MGSDTPISSPVCKFDSVVYLFLLIHSFIADSSIGSLGMSSLRVVSPTDFKTNLPEKTWDGLLNILQQAVMTKPEMKVKIVDFLVDNFSNIFDK